MKTVGKGKSGSTMLPVSVGTSMKYKAMLALLAGMTVSSCASMPDTAALQGTLAKASDGIRGGFGKLKDKASGSGGNSNANAALITNQFPRNEVPHTLMKKPLAEGRLTSGHGFRFSPTGVPIPKKHKGIDYAAPAGTPIYAAGDGVIVKHYVSKSYGNYVRIEHENGFYTAYAHMQAFVEGQGVGSIVKKGEMIGNVGSTGRSSGPHLHYELIHGNNFIDPLFEIAPEEQQASVK